MSKHVVVDGSNLATEGRSMPSLKQLNEAVLAYVEDHPDATITVVVDATFGHRIDPREVAEFDAAIEHNELVAPPAGAIGRGDAFVLMIAMKANATILSNDSFQEFHGEHPWLFEDDRLVGGKPVPHVGWVFVARSPVRGAISRRAVKAKKTGERPSSRRPRAAAARVSSDLANQPMPVPKMPPPVAARSSAPVTEAPVPAAAVAAPTPARVASANDLLAFLTFVERHPVGSLIGATIESYSSHGAYADCDGVKVYAPLRLMGEPAPRSAREVLKLGEERSFTVASFNPSRRSIDIALSTESVPMTSETTAPVGGPKAKKATRRKAPTPIVEVVTVDEPAPAKKTPVKKVPAKKASAKKAPEPVLAPVAAPAEPQVPAKKAQAKKVAAKAPAAKVPMTTTPAKKVPAKKVPAKKVPAKKVPAKKAAASPVPAPVVEPAAAPVKRAAAKKASTAPVKKAAPPTKAAVPVSKMAAPVKKAATAPARKAAAPAAKKAAATKKK